MPRTVRLQVCGGIYHVMNRGLARQNISFQEEDFKFFLKGLEEIYRVYKVEVFAFCLMSNHFHLLIRTPEANLSRSMRHFSHTYAQRTNRRRNEDGPIFRGRYKSIFVTHESYLTHFVRYIHLNPVKASLTRSAEDYKWSSARLYLTDARPNWLNASKILEHFGNDRNTALERYQNYLMAGNSAEIESFYARNRLGAILDDEKLIRAYDVSILRSRKHSFEINTKLNVTDRSQSPGT